MSTPETRRRINLEKRLALLKILGSKCYRCGNDDHRVLEIDHVNGDGKEDRTHTRHYGAKYAERIATNPDRYQILCANCHKIKTWEDREKRYGPTPRPLTDEERIAARAEFYSPENQRERSHKRTAEGNARIAEANRKRHAERGAPARNDPETGRFTAKK